MKRFILSLGVVFGLMCSLSFAQNTKIWTLQECLDYAMKNNIGLQQNQLQQQISAVNLLSAKAARYPNLNVGPQWSSSFGRSIDPTTNTFIDQRFDALNISANSNVTLWNNNRITNTIKQREMDLEASEKDVKQAEYDLALDVTLAYLNILFQGEILESARVQVLSTREQLDRTSKLVQAGSLAQADLAQVQSQIATEELNVVNAQNQLELAYLALQQLLLLDPEEPFGIQKPELADPQGGFRLTPTSEIYSSAIGFQPSIEAADLRIKSASLGEKIAEASMYPTVSLGVTAFTAWSGGRLQQNGTAMVRDTITAEIAQQEQTFVLLGERPTFGSYPFFNQLIDNYNVGLGLRIDIPIYNRRQVKSQIEIAQIQTSQAKLTAQLVRQSLQQLIEQAYVDARNALSTYSATQKQVEALELTFDNIQKQFDLGAANSVDFLVAKNNLNQSKFDLLRAKYGYFFRLKILDFYQGKPIDFE
ncbi:MAG: TolC family protein [Bacteroidota bacterium]